MPIPREFPVKCSSCSLQDYVYSLCPYGTYLKPTKRVSEDQRMLVCKYLDERQERVKDLLKLQRQVT